MRDNKHGQLYHIHFCNFCTIFYTSVIGTLALAQYEQALYLCLPTDVSDKYYKVVWVYSQGGGVVPCEWWLV